MVGFYFYSFLHVYGFGWFFKIIKIHFEILCVWVIFLARTHLNVLINAKHIKRENLTEFEASRRQILHTQLAFYIHSMCIMCIMCIVSFKSH